MQFDELSNKIIGCAIEVHRHLGPGLLEKTYHKSLEFELNSLAINFKSEIELPVIYKNQRIECGYRIDLLVENNLIVELKNVNEMIPIFDAQLLTYMKLANIKIGLLINFNVQLLKDGIKRFVL